jgi:hypothetical protein
MSKIAVRMEALCTIIIILYNMLFVTKCISQSQLKYASEEQTLL